MTYVDQILFLICGVTLTKSGLSGMGILNMGSSAHIPGGQKGLRKYNGLWLCKGPQNISRCTCGVKMLIGAGGIRRENA